MDNDEYRLWAHSAVDWTADYLDTLRDRPVRPDIAPGTIAAQLGDAPPEAPEPFATIFADFERIVPGGLTHWQHPRFFAYFPTNATPASVIADILVNAMSVNGLLWETSPAVTEMEIRMVDWLAQALGLPKGTQGVMQDSATSGTLCAVLTMRERALGWAGNRRGLAGGPVPRIYASAENHSSIDKACWVAGIGQENLVKVPTDAAHAMDLGALAAAIRADRAEGLVPAGVIVCAGGTGIGAFDRVADTIALARSEDLYTHVDAAWAGNAMICPEFRPLWAGIEAADSIVVNPYKGLGGQFDGSFQFLRDPGPQVRTLGLRPDYLKTIGMDEIVNLNEWTVQLGRRFRSLKLWFMIRAYGLQGLRRRMRDHVAWAARACERIAGIPGFEIATQPSLSLFTFRRATRRRARSSRQSTRTGAPTSRRPCTGTGSSSVSRSAASTAPRRTWNSPATRWRRSPAGRDRLTQGAAAVP